MQNENQRAVKQIDYEVRHLDPIETVSESFDDHDMVGLLKHDIARIDEILEGDTTLTRREKQELYRMGCNLRLDWLYAEHGGRELPLNEFSAAWDETNAFFARAGGLAQETRRHDPNYFWDVALKHLDLRALQAHRNAEESQTNLKGTAVGQKVWALADNQMKGVIRDSVRLMEDMQRYADSHTELAQDARGKLFETMLITYARLDTYESEEFDNVFVRSALDREDHPWNEYAYPKRAFDIVIQSGREATLLQAKNHKNNDQYAKPIHKVEDRHFGETLHNLPKYIAEFRLIISNPTDPLAQPALNRAHEELDEAFGKYISVS